MRVRWEPPPEPPSATWSSPSCSIGGTARHQIPLLWRYLHRVHHSPARIEVLTSFYKHPLEILLNGVLMSSILYVLSVSTQRLLQW
ncbi:MAG: sterol desaturase family protein [Rhodanobacteraceae bacterium]|nr:sterol desaturase family protein [Rhodanobacteraceae bacterium]